MSLGKDEKCVRRGARLQIYKICTQEHVEYGFGKREEDRRGLKWNKKEMPSLATQRNSRQEFRFGKISGQQDSL
ncbi:hypothetical protein ACMYM8_23165, partial [Salmonella enterica subsp. enterica serovar Enteritidis]|uniref:hypothetical protein n=1 Tax=Salmonella enterica TaxID=28901 RepID=UPI0039EA1B95